MSLSKLEVAKPKYVTLTEEEIKRIARWEFEREYRLTIDKVVDETKALKGQIGRLQAQIGLLQSYLGMFALGMVGAIPSGVAVSSGAVVSPLTRTASSALTGILKPREIVPRIGVAPEVAKVIEKEVLKTVEREVTKEVEKEIAVSLGARISRIIPYLPILIMTITLIATKVSEEVTRLRLREERIRREKEKAEIRKEIYREVIGFRDVEREYERARREAYRSVVPG